MADRNCTREFGALCCLPVQKPVTTLDGFTSKQIFKNLLCWDWYCTRLVSSLSKLKKRLEQSTLSAHLFWVYSNWKPSGHNIHLICLYIQWKPNMHSIGLMLSQTGNGVFTLSHDRGWGLQTADGDPGSRHPVQESGRAAEGLARADGGGRSGNVLFDPDVLKRLKRMLFIVTRKKRASFWGNSLLEATKQHLNNS